MAYRFWKWLFLRSRSKFREANLNKAHNDIKCDNCNEWYSISGIRYKHEMLDYPDWGCTTKCGQCGHVSHWNLVAAPVALRCDEKGSPL